MVSLDENEVVRLSEVSNSAKNTLDSLLIEIGSDTLNENSLREKAILARVQLLCLDESYESAKEWLDSLRVGLFLSYDSTIVDLLSAKLGALADTTLSLAELSDSLTKITSDEVQYAKRDESGFGKRSLDLVKMNKENRLFELALRPNPSSDHLTVTYSGPKVDKLELSIASLAGAGVKQESLFKVVSGSEVTIDTSCLPIGVYVLKGYNGDSTSTTMFVVVR